MTIKEKYDTLIQPEIKELQSEIDLMVSVNPEIKNLHLGWRVFFSPLIENPDILFVGINPGNGQAGAVDLDYFEDDAPIEYISYKNDGTGEHIESTYHLALETKKVFEMAHKSEMLKNAMKINYFYLSTTREKDLYDITSFLGRGKSETLLGDKLFLKSAEWTKRMIELTKPKLIICEGKAAYDSLTDQFNNYSEFDWTEDCGYTIYPNENFVVLGYGRIFSQIKNKMGLTNLIVRFTG